MYIITSKTDNVIVNMGKNLDYMDNGYPRLVDEDVAFVTESFNVYEVEQVPENVSEGKYCYTEDKSFYKNENYVEYYSVEDRLSAVEDMIDSIILGGLE